jgi:inner membrane protein
VRRLTCHFSPRLQPFRDTILGQDSGTKSLMGIRAMALQFVSSTSTTLKMALIGVVVLVLLIPLTMLRSTVQERAGLREEAYFKVAAGWGGKLTVGGPILIVPTERTVVEGTFTRVYREELSMLPTTLHVSADIAQEDEPRYVGIYQVPVYMASLKLSGTFDFATDLADIQARHPGRTLRWEQSRLRVPLSDVRSLRELSRARLGNADLAFSPVGRSGPYGAMDAAVQVGNPDSQTARAFNIEFKMAGSRELSFLPLGGTTTVQLHSDWPDPSFQGSFLPATRTITAEGFDASWQVLQLNRSFGQSWLEGELGPEAFASAAFGVGLYQAVDVYQRSERAMKYALLFIALTFMTFFVWEHMSRVRLHPLQYLLVGLALSIFYLLLIALSEHVPFVAAYWSAAIALVALIGVYLAGAMRKRLRGAVAAAAMTGVYAVLYALVLSESYSLLMGAIVLFAALGAVMLVTRNVDWYASADAAREQQ